MKTLLSLLLLASIAIASIPTKQAASDLNYITTEDTQCNTYLEYATNSLYLMSQAEQENNLKFINIHFNNFQLNSDIAIEYCTYINAEVTSELMEIQSAINAYYLRNYYEKYEPETTK